MVSREQRTLVILPTYNERENLPTLIGALLELGLPLDILVVDDASPDGTGQLADELARQHPQVHVLHREGKLGLGTAYVAGFRYAIRQGYGRIVTMDCDFSHHPRYLPAMIAATEKADLVVGSRYVRGGGTEGWGLGRRIISATANFTAKLLLGLRTRDCSAGFRCYRAEAVLKLGLNNVSAAGYSALEEITCRAERSGLRIAEVPIIFCDRTRGVTKMSFREMRDGVATLFRLWWHRGAMRPRRR